ncbi:MAG: peroxiredoxin [Myxococcales bacterium]|nr:peroxiredoxin [Myxococcales bacterium]USN50338.1 MAG: peroxiredoxin [Myxococcales bacterium]
MYTLIQKPAPDFSAEAVLQSGDFKEITLSSFRDKKYVALFFYPLDFTFVCPSEIIAFSKRTQAFEALNTQILGISVDSKFSHYAWRNTPLEKGGIGAIDFPLISDITKEISRDYGVLVNDSVALRGTFIIDMKGIVRHATLNDLPIGRNVDETLRVIEALQHTEKHGEVCPAGWTKGKQSMKPDAGGVAAYLANNAQSL